MFKTQEILTYTLIICIVVFLLVFYKDKLIGNKYIADVFNLFKETNKVEKKETIEVKESTDNLFATEYEVSEVADEAISDALKHVE